MDYVAVVCRCLIAGIFGIAALSKLRGRAVFEDFVRSTAVLLPTAVPRNRTIRWIGATVAAAEFAIAALIAVPATVRIGFGLSTVMLTTFILGIADVLRRGERVPCRCFGASTAVLRTRHLIRNALLLLVAGTGLALGPGDLDGTQPAGLYVAIGAATVLIVVVTRLDDLVALSTPLPVSSGSPSGEQ